MNITSNIFYCTENKDVVNNIVQDFQGSEIQFRPVSADNDELVRQILLEGSASILLITDNFLKNEDCMANAYRNFNHALKRKKILCIVADGRAVESDGQIVRVPTRIEHVSQIMQYLNYWQEKYLSVKKQFSSGKINETSHARIKNISSDMGAFLQILRDTGFYYFENLKTRNYQQFCQMMGISQPTLAGNTSPELLESADEIAFAPSEKPSAAERGYQIESPQESASQELFSSEIKQVDWLDKEEDPFVERPPRAHQSSSSPTTNLNEIDEDDFFNLQQPDKNQGSNIAEIVEEVLTEEEEEERVQNGGSHPELDNIAINEENDDDMEDLFVRSGQNELEIPKTGQVKDTDEAGIEKTVFGFDKKNKKDGLNKSEENMLPLQVEFRFKTLPFVSQFESKNYIISMDDNQKIKNDLQQIYGLAKGGNLDAAAARTETLLADYPDNPEVHFLCAEIAELQRNFLKARKHYQTVAELAPFFPKVYHKLSWLCMNHFPGEKKVTKSYFKHAMALDDNNPQLLYAYAEFLNEQGDTNKAIKYFKKVLIADPAHPFANYDLALIYHKLGDYNIANRYYIEACENNEELSTPENDRAFTGYSVLDVERAAEAINLHSAEESEMMMPVGLSINDDSESLSVFAENELADRLAGESEKELSSFQISATVNKFKPQKGAKIVLVTGASAGIGRATAEIFARNGYNMILTARREDRLVELQNFFHKHYSGGCIILDFDIRDYNSIETTLRNLDRDWRAVDILINNAGLAVGLDPIHEGNPEHWDMMIDTNIKGLLYMTRLVSSGMVERKSGHIINLCSTAGKEAYPNGNVYSATKFAVESLTRNMRIDLHKYGIRVGQISPGAVEETEFSQVRFLGDKEKAAKIYEGFIPLKPSDVADIVYYMASVPSHVNIQDVLVMGTQQASATIIDRSGR